MGAASVANLIVQPLRFRFEGQDYRCVRFGWEADTDRQSASQPCGIRGWLRAITRCVIGYKGWPRALRVGGFFGELASVTGSCLNVLLNLATAAEFILHIER